MGNRCRARDDAKLGVVEDLIARLRRHWLAIAFLVVAFILYAPHGWLLFADYQWNEHHWLWMRLWPILPGLPATLLTRFTVQSKAILTEHVGNVPLQLHPLTLAQLQALFPEDQPAPNGSIERTRGQSAVS